MPCLEGPLERYIERYRYVELWMRNVLVERQSQLPSRGIELLLRSEKNVRAGIFCLS